MNEYDDLSRVLIQRFAGFLEPIIEYSKDVEPVIGLASAMYAQAIWTGGTIHPPDQPKDFMSQETLEAFFEFLNDYVAHTRMLYIILTEKGRILYDGKTYDGKKLRFQLFQGIVDEKTAIDLNDFKTEIQDDLDDDIRFRH